MQIPQRLIVVPIIHDKRGRILICKKPADRGVFPGKWGLPGGGVEPGELLEQALVREIREELGIEVHEIRPLFFKEGNEPKFRPGEEAEPVHMIYLLYQCNASTTDLLLNEEFIDSAWVIPAKLQEYDLNLETIKTFSEIGVIESAAAERLAGPYDHQDE